MKITLPSSEALSGKPANVNAVVLSSAESAIPKKRGGFKGGCTVQDFGLSNTKELSGPHLTVRQFSHEEDSSGRLLQNSPRTQIGTHSTAPSFLQVSDIRKKKKKSNSSPENNADGTPPLTPALCASPVKLKPQC